MQAKQPPQKKAKRRIGCESQHLTSVAEADGSCQMVCGVKQSVTQKGRVRIDKLRCANFNVDSTDTGERVSRYCLFNE